YAFSSKDFSAVITHGVYIALSDLSSRLIGGDVYLKRAVAATVTESGGNRNATNTSNSKQNLVDAITGVITGTAQAQPDATVGAFEINTLLGNIAVAHDYSIYKDNAQEIDSLLSTDSSSAFAAGWAITLEQAHELGLDRRNATDWNGGWS